jgi:hypothetical protein
VLLASWPCLALWFGAQLCAPLCAAAQSVHGAPRVNTVVDACVPVDADLFHRLLAIELGTSIEYAPTAAQEPDGTAVTVACTRDGAVQLLLDDNLTRKSMQRVVELPLVEIAMRTRLLALSVAELVVASWVELQLAQPPLAAQGLAVPQGVAQTASAVAGARLPATAGAPAPAEEEPAYSARWLLGVSAEAMLFSGGSGLLPQLSLHLEQRPSSHVVLGLGLSLGHANWDVNWPFPNAGTALLTTSTGRLTFGYIAQLSALELSIAAGARGGVVYMAGDTARLELLAVEMYAPWGGPLALLAAAGVVGPFRVTLEIEAGYVTLPAEALIAGTVVAELRGVWGSVGLGVGWLF